MAVTEPTDSSGSEIQQTDVQAGETEMRGPRGSDRWIWLSAGIIFLVAGLLAAFQLDKALFAVIAFVLGFACMVLAGGAVRRRRGGAPPV